MNREMKIAIPTDDGSIVKSRFCRSRGFVVATVEKGEIVHSEMRWNLLSEMMTSTAGSSYNLHDCNVLLVNGSRIGYDYIQKAGKIMVIRTTAITVTAAFKDYLNTLKKPVPAPNSNAFIAG
ncbi:MAG: hypothetical protein NTU98_13125 [Bacteroidetes bacterium]|nr:hypothetical protein [Bacteroidota bacterium]